MTPTIYMNEIVIQTVQDFMDARGDRRKAYLACIASFHLCDYVARTDGVPVEKVRAFIADKHREPFNIVEGVCNGSKRGTFKHQPGYGGFGDGRFEHAGLQVEHNGNYYLVDLCLQVFLLSMQREFTNHFGATLFKWAIPGFGSVV